MIHINNLSKSFDENTLFSNFNMQINDGEFIIFTGASGCGKTTLLNMIGGIEPFDKGEIMVDNINIANRKNKLNYFKYKVGFLFQNFALIENKTVEENLKLVKKDCKSNVSIEQALNDVNLSDKIYQKVYKLSGGEQQRVALARLMVKKCDIILADEPTGSLDRKNSEMVLNFLKSLNAKGKTIVLVTHDEYVKGFGSRVVEM
ncbi:MAG: ATP-binding cassette domain-containing protein [Oscillospiraceae bacterium]